MHPNPDEIEQQPKEDYSDSEYENSLKITVKERAKNEDALRTKVKEPN